MKHHLKIIGTSIFILLLFFYNEVIFAEKPLTIPALKEWKDETGEFIFNHSSRIFIDPKYSQQLLTEAQTLIEDIKNLKGINLSIEIGNYTKLGDIFLTMNSEDKDIGKEGYTITINDIIVINAKTEVGVFYGTRTVLQLLKNTNNIKSGCARDWPQYKERGLMVDNGRKYFTIKWLENHIKELAYLKFNYFHLHISDNEGFRLECTSHPEITSFNFYSKTEIISLQNLAKKYHIIIVPEIDMPGHMGAILIKHQNDFAIKDKDGGLWGGMVDFTLDKVRLFINDLLHEYLELFTGPYWHIGADEGIIDNYEKFPQFLAYAQKHYGINAQPKDAIIDFINWTDSIVKAYGKRMRMWNDYLSLDNKSKSTISINNDIILEFWLSDFSMKNQPQELLVAGYSLMNCNVDILYYILGLGWRWQNKPLYESWEPNIFEYNRVVPKDHPGMLGCKLQIWCDNPENETEGVVSNGIRSALRVLSQSFWGSPKLVPEFLEFEKIVDSLGFAPGVVFPENPMPNNLVFRKRVVASSIEKGTVFKPELAIDGSYDTKWSSDHNDNEWIYVDLGKSYNITKVKLNWADSYPLNYQIQTSNDTINWTTIYYNEEGNEGIIDLKNLSGKGRFLRIFCSKQLVDTVGFSLWEFEVYDSISIKNGYDYPNTNEMDEILKCYPNPADNKVFINYKLDFTNFVKLVIFDLQGQKVTEFENNIKSEGNYQIIWNIENISRGEYFCCLYIGTNLITQKVILIK
jgi:hexosaminidase